MQIAKRFESLRKVELIYIGQYEFYAEIDVPVRATYQLIRCPEATWPDFSVHLQELKQRAERRDALEQRHILEHSEG